MSTSLFEPFGLVIPEAMSCGLPVVAYDSPFGPSSIITDGVDGYLIPPGNEQLFADRLAALMADESLRCQMGSAAVNSAKRYSPTQVMPLWQELFSTVAC
jgi:glycosyltransferase involved in cell wall biosynthesis